MTKRFRLSKRQMRLEKSPEKVRTAVRGLSFKAYEGEIYGLLGPNGAGKTTTLRMLATLIRPDEGNALVDGHSVLSDPDKVRASIGFLTSELKLEDFFTPNYLFDFFASLHGFDPEQAKKRKEALFGRFGIDAFAEAKVSNLSTGMKQKTSLAIALAHDPKIVIFDEPTNGLDVITAKTVTDFLLELKGQGKTILVSSHIFSLVEKLCDRVGIILNGEMALEGSLLEVRGDGALEDRFFEIYAQKGGALE
jgi:sodium transport system ATP-binding protein